MRFRESDAFCPGCQFLYGVFGDPEGSFRKPGAPWKGILDVRSARKPYTQIQKHMAKNGSLVSFSIRVPYYIGDLNRDPDLEN